MRFRILYSNGKTIQDLFWLEHNGTDVYCGPTKVALKRSYHASGKVHMDAAGEREHHKWHTPLARLTGGWCLLTTGFRNAVALRGAMSWPAYTGKAGDAFLLVDGRSIPPTATVQLDVGLCECGSLVGIPQLRAPFSTGAKVRQLLLHTDSAPWVYVAVIW